ncbi:MAG TPA: hypothetical protein VFW96_22955 [Thermomicrobiales bacterium]|nr:hypothetical protein [Thermomicrobiales bacterium]
MSERDWRDAVTAAFKRGPAGDQAVDEPVDAPADEDEWCRRAGFTPGEQRQLAFVRWLYRQGRLTEWGTEPLSD